MTIPSRLPTDDERALVAAERRDWNRLWMILTLALVARLMALAVWSENLTDDRDGYLELADGLAAGRGFSVPGTETPTAYRPPLYPLVLIPGAFLTSGLWTAVLHVGLGLLTVWLTFLLAQRLVGDCTRAERFGDAPVLAAAIVAVDPILLRYATLPMTETLATCLVTGVLVTMTPASRVESASEVRRRSLAVGVLFGLAALSRPTVWAFAGLVGIWIAGRRVAGVDRREPPDVQSLGAPVGRPQPPASIWNGSGVQWMAVVVGTAVVVLPWGVRNLAVFGRPIVMTTHGGYTLLLGNNPAFSREVVDQPWGTVWDGSHGGGQTAWVTAVNQEMESQGLRGEVERDRWMSQRAWSYIRAAPLAFLRACWLRLRRFWGVVPVEGASQQPRFVRWSVGTFDTLVLLGALIGGGIVVRHGSPAWGPSVLMLCAFTGVHLVYWTNTRMRAPIVPVIAILAALGWCRMLRRDHQN